MTVVLTVRTDIDLDTVHRVAWLGENVRLSETALRRIAASSAVPTGGLDAPLAGHQRLSA